MPILWRAKRVRGIGRLGQNTVILAFGLGVRALVQMTYLVLLSRWLGPEGYGYFAGSVAAATILSPLAGWGVSFLVASEVGRDKSAVGPLWATALFQISLSGIVLVGLLLLVSGTLLENRVSMYAMFALALAELVALPVANAASGLSLAAERGLATTVTLCLVPVGRVAMALLVLASGSDISPDQMAGMHLLGSLLGAGVACLVLARIGVRPEWRARIPAARATRAGFSHSLGGLVGASYTEIDKVLMLQMLDASTTGTYTVAFRAAFLFILPISALGAAVVPRIFSVAGTEKESTLRRAMVRSMAGYSLVAAVAAALAAPMLPVLFGDQYSGATTWLLMLAPWIPIYASHQYLGTRLSTSGFQGLRVAIEFSGFLSLVLLNLWWVPRFGPGGAVASLLITEGLVTTALLMAVKNTSR